MVQRYWFASLGLFLVQTAPIAVVLDSNGWYRIAAGGRLS